MAAEDLTFFDPWEHIDIHGSRVPHWQQPGATYFITFRLADSLPANKLDRWKQEREHWHVHHPIPWSEDEENDYHRRFTVPVDRWLDQGHGDCELQQATLREQLSNTIRHANETNYVIHSFILMPNHAHLLFSLAPDGNLESTVQVWKGVSARRINKLRGKSGSSFWMKGYFDRLIRDAQHFRNVARYIRNNPTKAQLPSGKFTLYESAMVQELLLLG